MVDDTTEGRDSNGVDAAPGPDETTNADDTEATGGDSQDEASVESDAEHGDAETPREGESDTPGADTVTDLLSAARVGPGWSMLGAGVIRWRRTRPSAGAAGADRALRHGC